MQMTALEIAEACGERILCGDPQTMITSVSTDSRKISPGALFVPIRGERTDAHAYISATFAAGAAATLTQNDTEKQDNHVWIAVPDTVEALRRIAAAYRSRFTLPVIGITGSVGKTTTKEMVALALSSRWNTMKTEGNQNSQVGLPLTMFRLLPEHEVAVIEMGMSDFGEMARLAQVARPQYAVMTNIGVSTSSSLARRKIFFRKSCILRTPFCPAQFCFSTVTTRIWPGCAIGCRRCGRSGSVWLHGVITVRSRSSARAMGQSLQPTLRGAA